MFYRKAPQPWPSNAGKEDAALTDFFAHAPTTYDVYWSYIHEPEDNIAKGQFSSKSYRTA